MYKLDSLNIDFHKFHSIHSHDYENYNLTTVICEGHQVNNIVIISGTIYINDNCRNTDICIPKEIRPKTNISILFQQCIYNHQQHRSTHTGGISPNGYFYILGNSHQHMSTFTVAYTI